MDNVVAVFGSNDPSPGDEAYEGARRAGRVLAEHGFIIANGGYGGTMAASSQGAKDAGGRTIGVTCSIWSSQANVYTDEVIVTQDLSHRVSKLVELGRSGYLVLPGATGTLVEFAWVWELKAKRFMQPSRPVVCLGEFWRPVVELMCSQRPTAGDAVSICPSPEALSGHFGT